MNNISFIGSSKEIVFCQVMVNRKNYRKTFDTKKLGLLPAIAMAKEWVSQIRENK